jgi:N-acetylglucosaminyl-diphospho-decaprenol L-rhamnosyltransferase
MLLLTDLTIVVVNWHTREHVLACVESVFGSGSALSLEVVVVDNASHDGCLEALRAKFPTVSTISADVNLGFAGANNLVVKRAAGRHIMLLNPDTRVSAGALDALVSFADANPDVGILGPLLRNPDGSAQPSAGKLPTLSTELIAQLHLYSFTDWGRPIRPRFTRRGAARLAAQPSAREVGWVSGACLMMRKDVRDSIGLLDQGYFMYVEDTDYCKRAWQAGYRVVYLPTAEIVHYGGVASAQAFSEQYVHGSASMLRYFKKFHPKYAQWLFRGILFAGSISRAAGLLALSAFRGRRADIHVRLQRQVNLIRLALQPS